MFRRQLLTAAMVVLVAASSLTGAAWVGRAHAAQTASVGGNALKVSPVRFDIKLDPGVTQKISLYVQNLGNDPAKFRVHINDFVAGSDESGRPSIILDDNEYAPSHSLKRFILPMDDVVVGGGETKEVKVTISVPDNAAGGGYFAAVRFAPADREASRQLSLSASVGTLVLLTVNGDIKEELSVESFDARKKDNPGMFFMDNKDLNATVRFKNSGNVQVEPFGKVTLKRFGKSVGDYEVNEAASGVRSNVLPDSIRRFSVDLKDVGSFGKYELIGNFGYGSSGQLLTATTTFYVVPLAYIIIGSGALLFLLFLIIGLPRMIRSYNRRVIRRANRRRY